MTRIQFLHGASDRLATVADWLRQAWQVRRPVLVFAPDPPIAERLDHLLWTQPATGFLPHCRTTSPLAAETPILIADRIDEFAPRDRCLLNLSDEVPPGFSRFDEIVEIVSTADADRLPARDRFRFYREQGCPVENQDVSGGLRNG